MFPLTLISAMHTTTIHKPTLPSLPLLPLPSSKPRVAKSPYPGPVACQSKVPVTPARKAYRRLKSMISTLKPTKPSQVAAGQRGEMPTQDGVSGGQLAPERLIMLRTQPHQMTMQNDEFYGWAQAAKTGARFISTLLNCPETLPSTDPSEININPDLGHFIALALRRSHLPFCVHQYASYLIWRVKSLNPEFSPRHAHGTYLTALMLAAKQSHDGVYSLDDWAWIGQDIFEASQLREKEWQMCERLGWKFLVHPMDLVKFAWTMEVEYGELDEGAPSSNLDCAESGLGMGRLFSASTASLSSLSSSSCHSLSSPWSGWGETTLSDSSMSTPGSVGLVCNSSSPSPFILA
ncbi:hypothetical protein RSOLAG22IIIB_11228 [Rhizoctonia solani]|uniref:Cyclin N-terminal domain-containing protein n=1 Tax=Rhizoctonia solani TaxID=456999 RepID=A0A0K6G790_9AGAM|nr:hypothetical protein RSOLAG22IIIB_11228 [Rhizoctonia solani]